MGYKAAPAVIRKCLPPSPELRYQKCPRLYIDWSVVFTQPKTLIFPLIFLIQSISEFIHKQIKIWYNQTYYCSQEALMFEQQTWVYNVANTKIHKVAQARCEWLILERLGLSEIPSEEL